MVLGSFSKCILIDLDNLIWIRSASWIKESSYHHIFWYHRTTIKFEIIRRCSTRHRIRPARFCMSRFLRLSTMNFISPSLPRPSTQLPRLSSSPRSALPGFITDGMRFRFLIHFIILLFTRSAFPQTHQIHWKSIHCFIWGELSSCLRLLGWCCLGRYMVLLLLGWPIWFVLILISFKDKGLSRWDNLSFGTWEEQKGWSGHQRLFDWGLKVSIPMLKNVHR